MSQLFTLMYHSIYSNDAEWNQIRTEDQPYALHIDTFNQHLDYLLSHDFSIVNPVNSLSSLKNEKSVLFTFDDGHIGFYKYAFPALVKRGVSAIFFITSDLIENPDRPEFCNWSQLKEMAEAGMSLQSHGQSHDFFADMTTAQTIDEFNHSKQAIEDNTGCKVWSISFPGGRYTRENIKQGKLLGFSHFFTSDFGIDSINSLGNGGQFFRHAIRVNTNLDSFKKMVNISGPAYLKSKLVYLAKKSLKLVIGNKNYHKLYKRLAG